MHSRLHGALREWLWAWAVVLAAMIALAWMLGSWSSGSNIVHSILFILGGGYFAWLIVSGWIEWRQRRRSG